ncbi:MAG: cell division protein FtsZ [Deltaproteobacteria bacterium]|nr:cell division protein FtsZ [Deltaproteobacteria bacterium]
MEFEFVEPKPVTRIKVIGIGGAGKNAVNNMINSGLEGVGFIAANTDSKDLERSLAGTKILMGAQLTRGLGCGADPEKGRAAAEEAREEIQKILGDSDMVFITAGMGGGTGTGAAPVIAECLKELKDPPLTVAVVTKPFNFEGNLKMRQALAGVERLKEAADTIIIIPNDRLMTVAQRGALLKDAFKLSDDVLLKAVKGISDIILLPGFVSVDFQDAKRVMSYRGQALMGTGQASGQDRAIIAAQQAFSSPLLDDISIQGAQGILINVSTSEYGITLEEFNDACSLIQKEAHPEAIVIPGVAWDNSLDDQLRVTVIATGLGVKDQKMIAPVAAKQGVPSEKRIHVASLDDVLRNADHFDQPAVRRPAAPAARGNLASYEKPGYSKYESFPFDDEELERPTFMRLKAD